MDEQTNLVRVQIEEATQAVAKLTNHRPRVGIVLGSGFNALADELQDADHIPYTKIPHFRSPSVPGHVGQFVIGRFAGQDVLVQQGRVHGYEGIPQSQVVLPVRVMHALGVSVLVTTNAAGGLNPAFDSGDLMLITDHIGLAAVTGLNPLYGPNDSALGPRFVDMIKAYDPELRRMAHAVASTLGFELRQGVYCGLAGPTFETPAEVRFLRIIGADAVGMSTVAEVIAARHLGMRVLGISGISNMAIADPDADLQVDHEEVLSTGRQMVPRLTALLAGTLERLRV